MNGNRHRVLPPPGGNGENPGGLPKKSKKVNKRGCKQRFAVERSNPLFTELWRRSRLVCVFVKTTPQKTPFRDVKYAIIWDTD